MRVMVIVKGSEKFEAGQNPSPELIAKMGAYNEELVKAGVMKDAAGLKRSKEGKRVRFDGASRSVVDGPFAETKELVGGFWIWEVASMDDAVAWLKKAPFTDGEEVELRPFQGPEDFA